MGTLISRDTLRPSSFHWRPGEPFLAKKNLHTLLEDAAGENSPPSSYPLPVFNEGCTFYQPRGKVPGGRCVVPRGPRLCGGLWCEYPMGVTTGAGVCMNSFDLSYKL